VPERAGHQIHNTPRALRPFDKSKNNIAQILPTGNGRQILAQLDAHHAPQRSFRPISVQQRSEQFLHLRTGQPRISSHQHLFRC
jgi:hypothetical protein